MCVSVRVCIYECVYLCMSVCLCMNVCICECIYEYVSVYLCMNVCTGVLCVCVLYTQEYAGACGGQDRTLSAFLTLLCLIALRHGLSLNLKCS